MTFLCVRMFYTVVKLICPSTMSRLLIVFHFHSKDVSSNQVPWSSYKACFQNRQLILWDDSLFKHTLSCRADLALHYLPPPRINIWTGMLSLSEYLHGVDRTNVCSFVCPSVPHTHRGHSPSGFDRSGSNDASHHHTGI